MIDNICFNVLLIEDNPGDVRLIAEYIKESMYSKINLISKGTLADAFTLLDHQKTDAVLLDLSLPDSFGLDTLNKLRSSQPHMPVIILTNLDDADVAIAALQEGAQDFLPKNQITPDLLVRTIRYSIERKQAEEALRESEDKFKYIFDNSTVPKSITSINGDLNVNQAFADLLGYSIAELSHMKWQDITHPDDMDASVEGIRDLLSGKIKVLSFEKRYLHQKGSVIWAEVSTSLRSDHEGNPQYFITSFLDITARKNTEEALKISEKKYKVFVESTPDLVFLKDENFKYLVANKAICDFYGLAEADILNRSDSELIPLQTARLCHKSDIQAIETNDVILTEEKLGERFFETLKFPVEYQPGKVGIGGIIRDITLRKEAARIIEENSTRLELAMQAAKMAWWEMNVKTGKVVFEKRKAEMLGFSAEQFNSYHDFVALLHPDDMDIAMRAMHDHLSGKSSRYETEYRIRNSSGEYLWFYDIGGAVNYDEKGQPLNVTGLVLDISERKKTDQALHESEERFRTIFENVQDVYYDVDLDGTIVEVSPSVAILTENLYTREDLIGKSIYDFYADPATRDQFIEKLKEKGHVSDYEIRLKAQSGRLKYCAVNSRIIFDEMGEPIKIIGTIHDVNQRKIAEQKIIELNEKLEQRVAERTARLEAVYQEQEAFSYSVSHDLRAPLRRVHGFTQILIEEYGNKLDDEGMRLCKVIMDNALRMGALIDDLLSFAQLSRCEMSLMEVDMKQLVRSVFNDICDSDCQRRIRFDLQDLCNVQADLTMMRQVWANLLSNAVKYSSKREQSVITIKCEMGPGEVVYSVKDNGVGFDMAYKDKLFSVFQRLHTAHEFEGTGVGLAIVERIIKRHGGKLWAESQLNQGAEFFFSLPLSR
jgi:PAS domain S-box-containing protein